MVPKLRVVPLPKLLSFNSTARETLSRGDIVPAVPCSETSGNFGSGTAVEEHSYAREAASVRSGGGIRRENVGTSNRNQCENR